MVDPRLVDLIAMLGGCVAHGGLYRVHKAGSIVARTKMVEEAMPSMRGRVLCFGGDWLGRQFALDNLRSDAGENLVIMLEPGTGEALEIPVTVGRFHDSELVDYADAALATQFYEQWRAASGDDAPIDDRTCVGYRVPLFLGGADTVDNLERSDIEVYWHLMGELREATR